MRPPHSQRKPAARRMGCLFAAALGWVVIGIWPSLSPVAPAWAQMHGTAGSEPALRVSHVSCCPHLWAPHGIPSAYAAPVDWSLPRGYRGTLVRERPCGFPLKLIALTFDDGPDGEVTPQILESLAAHRAQATFFVLGCQARRQTGLLRQMATTGHVVGNHSYSHPSHPSAAESRKELSKTAGIIRQVTCRTPVCFRPPYGITKNALTPLALREGYAAVLWTVDTGDALGHDTKEIIATATRAPTPGQIILMHDGRGHHETAQAVPIILEKLSSAGFRFVTIPELLYAWDQWLRRPVAACPKKGASD